MISQGFLNDLSTYTASRIKSNALLKVIFDNGVIGEIPIPTTVTTTENVVNCSFVVDNAVSGLLVEMSVLDTDDLPIEVASINFKKKAGSLFIGSFKFTIKEGERV